ncbi:MAG: short-chain dehydrogenase [Glaciihabitans sp.]|nr:short-chain dehydrogenase [Glaciihabitans sp.]
MVRGKTIVLTGASSGIGAAAAAELSRRGWDVAVVGRNPDRTRAVAASVGGSPFLADFDRLDDVRTLAGTLLARYASIDVLANNAGGLSHERGRSADGFEHTIQQNHLAPFLLTNLLLPRLAESNGRVISTGSNSNTWGALRLDDLNFDERAWFGGWRAYGTSKLATILFTRELARHNSVSAYAFHPGYIASRFGASTQLMRFAAFVGRGHLGGTVETGAAPLVWLADSAKIEAPSGTYFDHQKPDGRAHRLATDDDLARRLWAASEQLVGLAS